MAWSNAAMQDAANALRQKYHYAQLHSAAAGGSGTANLCSSPRMAFSWAAASGNGDFDVLASISFTGGASSGAVHSVTVWSADTAGTFGGEFALAGDASFNNAGEYMVTSIAQSGSST